jgi:hypothetical protein
MKHAAIETLCAAIDQALDDTPVSDVLAALTGAFVGLTIELVRRQGLDVNKEIKVDGGQQRDITIHAPKNQDTE